MECAVALTVAIDGGILCLDGLELRFVVARAFKLEGFAFYLVHVEKPCAHAADVNFRAFPCTFAGEIAAFAERYTLQARSRDVGGNAEIAFVAIDVLIAVRLHLQREHATLDVNAHVIEQNRVALQFDATFSALCIDNVYASDGDDVLEISRDGHMSCDDAPLWPCGCAVLLFVRLGGLLCWLLTIVATGKQRQK